MLKAILIILCLGGCLALHYQQSYLKSHAFGHFQQVDPQKLQNIEFEQQFTQIQNQVDYVSRTVDLKDADKYSFIIERCKEITSGINALHRSLVRNHLIIIPQKHICPGISTFNRTQINRYIAYTEDKDKQLSLYYSTCTDCQFITPDIEKMIDITHSFFTLINKTLNGDFCPHRTLNQSAKGIVNLNNSYFKVNLLAKNWFYGSISKSDYKILMFKRSSSFNLTNCPINTPYLKFSEQICFGCPDNSLFNLGTETCITCSMNEFFNVDTKQCEICNGNKQVVNNTIVCRLCVLSNSEIYNSTIGKCQKCEGNRYLDRVDHLCKPISCPATQPRFNSTTQLCEPCALFQVIDPHDPAKCIKTNYIGICPPQTPLYNMSTHSCVACPSGSLYSLATDTCQQKKS